jgi:O-antigen ligase
MPRNGDAATFTLTAASATAGIVSIAASQILLAAAYLGFVLIILGRRHDAKALRWPSYFIPLGAFMMTTLIALAASPDPGVGWHPVQKFVLFPMGLLAANFVTTEWRARTCYRLLLTAGAVAALAGILQFALKYATFSQTNLQQDDPTLVNRITGTMGHWMTFSGVELLVWCAGVPAILVLSRRWVLPLTLVALALVLSHTRGVWIGAAAAFSAIFPILGRRVLLVVLIPMAMIGLAASPLIYRRFTSSFDSGLATNYSRKVYFDVGARMIQDHPVFGVGPERIDDEFANYYPNTTQEFFRGHLHNNVLQIAAERGLVCLGTFLWFIGEIYRSLVQLYRRQDAPRWATLGALSALTGFFVAGMTEYNFGDSEVLLLLLFIVSIPFGLAHVQKDPDRQPG